MKGCNFVRDEVNYWEEIFKGRLVGAYQDSVQLKLLFNALKKIGKVGLIAAGLVAGVGALEYHIDPTGITHNIIERGLTFYDYLNRVNPETGTSLIQNVYKPWLLAVGGATLTATTLGLWGLNSLVSTKYDKKNTLADAVLKITHPSRESEAYTYANKSKRHHSRWERRRDENFDVLAGQSELSEVLLTAYDHNLLLKTRYPKKASKKSTILWTIEDIVNGMNNVTGRVPFQLAQKKGVKVNFPLPIQPNQPKMHFYGELFPKVRNVEGDDVEEFLGYELVLKHLSSGKTVIGSLSTLEPKRYTLNPKNYALAREVMNEALWPIYRPKKRDFSIAHICEATFPGVKGGVSSVLYQLIKNMNPHDLGVESLQHKVVSIYAFPGPAKTRIVYKPTDDMHVLPPIIAYGHTKNPALDRFEVITDNPLFSGINEGETSEQYRKRELKNTLREFEKAFSEQKIDLFYKVAKKMQCFSIDELLHSRESIEVSHEMYHQIEDENKPSFKYYRNEWRVLRRAPLNVIKSDKVEADVYYALLTGVAGVYAALCKKEFDKRMVLTEHGIYNEDIKVFLANTRMHPYMVRLWENALDFYSKITYEAADSITTLCQSNFNKQLRDGASADKIQILPVGIGLDPKKVIVDDDALHQKNVCNVGCLANVQPVKRIGLYIAVAEYLKTKYPYVGWNFDVMGGDDVNAPTYAKQIHSRVDQSSILEGIFHFKPYMEHYSLPMKHLDIGVLTSSSEVMPVSIIEFMSLGKIPVTLNVGALDEMINGTQEDKDGPAGIVLPVDNFENEVKSFADAILALYFRKYFKITGENHEMYEKHCLAKYKNSKFLNHDYEGIGKKRSFGRYDAPLVLPKYARVFRPEANAA